MRASFGIARRSMAFALAGTLASVSALMSQEAQRIDRAADREAILTILTRWQDAWNRHDMHAYASLYHDDGVWVLWTGGVWSGRQAIEEGHAEVHKTIFRNSIQREQLEELTFVGQDAAVVRFCSVLTGDERAPDKLVRSRKFLVVTKRDGTWRIGWGQNTRLADTVPDSECLMSLRKAMAGR